MELEIDGNKSMVIAMRPASKAVGSLIARDSSGNEDHRQIIHLITADKIFRSP